MSDVQVTHNPQEHRYEAHIDGALAGFVEYEKSGEVVDFTHTEVDSAFEGQGVGGALARYALDDVRAEGTHQVKPTCPFIKGWIDKHPDYLPLVAGAGTAGAEG